MDEKIMGECNAIISELRWVCFPLTREITTMSKKYVSVPVTHQQTILHSRLEFQQCAFSENDLFT